MKKKLKRLKCWWYDHDWKTKWFDRSALPKGAYYMQIGIDVCSRCDEGLREFNIRQMQINVMDAYRQEW